MIRRLRSEGIQIASLKVGTLEVGGRRWPETVGGSEPARRRNLRRLNSAARPRSALRDLHNLGSMRLIYVERPRRKPREGGDSVWPQRAAVVPRAVLLSLREGAGWFWVVLLAIQGAVWSAVGRSCPRLLGVQRDPRSDEPEVALHTRSAYA